MTSSISNPGPDRATGANPDRERRMKGKDRMGKLTLRPSQAEAGQSLLEFAIMVLVLTITLMGILDIGRAYYSLIALQDAAGEGAAYAAIKPTCLTSMQCPDPDNITWRTKNASPSGLVNRDRIQVNVNAASLDSGNPITVTATYQHRLLTFVIGSIVGSDKLELQAQAKAVIQ